MVDELPLELLGYPEIRLAGSPVTGFTSNKVQALLCYLAVTGRPHLRPALAGLLWGELPEVSAQNNLRKALSILHRLVGPHVDIDRDRVAFNRTGAYRLDVEAFEARIAAAAGSTDVAGLVQAVDLYRDDFLAGFYVRDAPDFEDWALAERARLRMLALQALHLLAAHLSGLGMEGWPSAVNYANRLLALEPWREEAHRQLMLLLAASGQRSAALAQYETCRRLLAEEMGVEPDHETTALYESIRDGTLVAPPFVSPSPAFVHEGAHVDTAAVAPIFVGRRWELARLDDFLRQALAGYGRVAFVIGEPGSGKSVLAQEFVRRAMDAHPDLAAASGRCNAYTGIGDPYLPFLEILQMLTGDVEARWAGGAVSDDHARRLWGLMPDAVQTLADKGPDLIERFVPGGALLARARAGALLQAAGLADVLHRRATPGSAGNLQQTDLFEQYTTVLAALSRAHPLILVVDDLQWADLGSIGLLFHLGRRLAGSRILLVGAYRPGDIAVGRAGAGSEAERHPLEPVIHELQREMGDIHIDLGQSEGRQFVDALLDSEPNRLGPEFRDVLYRHTGGHPLFTVELLRGLRDSRGLVQDEAGRWIAGPALDWDTLPPRVEAVIAERIGRLPEDWQSLLVAASVEGEEFTAEVVARVQAVDESLVVRQLSGPLSRRHRLVVGQGVQRLGGQRLSRYRFRHFLFQKYLYATLDPVRRADLHEAVGQTLESLYDEQAVDMAVPLARHFEAAGMTARAVEYLLRAGDRAARLFANEEAIAHYRRGIELVGTLEDTPQRARIELALQLALGVPLIATRGFSGVETAAAYLRARELARSVDALPELFQAGMGLKGYYDVHADLQEASQTGEELLQVALRLNDPSLAAMAHHMASTTPLHRGQSQVFLEQREQMCALYDAERDRFMAYRFGLDPYLASTSHAGWAYWYLGYPDQARQRIEEAVELATETGHPFLVAFALMFAAFESVYLREVRAARANAEQTIAVAGEHGQPLWLGGGIAVLGWVLGQEGKMDEAIAQLRKGLAMARSLGAQLGYLQELSLLADTFRKAGKATEGLAVVDEALAIIEATGCTMDEPEVHRLKGELLLQRQAAREAEECFRRAIEVAGQQQAKSWELRSTMSLCRLWQKQGKAEQARQALAPVYAWFSEGFDTPDLQEAKRLLKELA